MDLRAQRGPDGHLYLSPYIQYLCDRIELALSAKWKCRAQAAAGSILFKPGKRSAVVEDIDSTRRRRRCSRDPARISTRLSYRQTAAFVISSHCGVRNFFQAIKRDFGFLPITPYA